MDNDIDALSSSMTTQSRGTLMRGALREMRVNLGVETPDDGAAPLPRIRPTDEDLPSLRDRIRRNVEDTELLAAAQPAPPSPAQVAQSQRDEFQQAAYPQRPLRNDFSDIMALPQPGYDAPPLRQSFAHDYGQDTDDLRYAEPPPRQPNRHDPRYSEPPRGLMAPHVEAATEQAFRQLSDAILNRALGDRTLEEMARDMLRAQIKQWIDTHLPQLVEDIVREEIERVSRGR
jgi:uncharacterized protein